MDTLFEQTSTLELINNSYGNIILQGPTVHLKYKIIRNR